jgi:hypothetical protein
MTEETLQVATALYWKIGELRHLEKESSKEDISIERLFGVIETFNLETDGNFYSSEFKIKLRKELKDAISSKLDELEKQLSKL